MKWESTLKKITDKTALKAASLWVDKPDDLQLINNQINCVYRFESQGKGYYLRFTHENIRSFDEVAAAIDFQNHLFLNNAPITEAALSKLNRFIEHVSQGELVFIAHVCLEIPGKIMDFEHTEKSAYTTWGRALAQLHQASQSYNPKNHLFNSWQDLWQETRDYVKHEEHEIQALYLQIDTKFKHFAITPANFGLTHADHRPGNVIYDGKQIHIIDFDEPVYHWYLSDIAKPFLDLCNKPYHEWKHLFDWYIEGYRSILPISDNDLESINWISQMKSLDIYLWCKNNWFAPTAPGGKPRDQWLNELRHMAITPLFGTKSLSISRLIRPAELSDADTISQLVIATLKEVNAKDYPEVIINALIKNFSKEQIAERMSKRKVFVMIEENCIIGTAALDENMVHSVFVLPNRQNEKIGAQLMEHIERTAHEQGFHTLTVNSSITAEGFYKKLGYTVLRKQYYGDELTLVMEKPI